MVSIGRVRKNGYFIVALISIFLQNSAVFGQYYHTIDKNISKEEYDNIKYLIDPYVGKLDYKNVFIINFESFKVIRLYHEDLCWRDFCLNIITSNCGETRCPSTVIIGSDRFSLQRFPIDKHGLMLKFPTRIDGNYTNVIVNSQYVAAFQGL